MSCNYTTWQLSLSIFKLAQQTRVELLDALLNKCGIWHSMMWKCQGFHSHSIRRSKQKNCMIRDNTKARVIQNFPVLPSLTESLTWLEMCGRDDESLRSLLVCSYAMQLFIPIIHYILHTQPLCCRRHVRLDCMVLSQWLVLFQVWPTLWATGRRFHMTVWLKTLLASSLRLRWQRVGANNLCSLCGVSSVNDYMALSCGAETLMHCFLCFYKPSVHKFLFFFSAIPKNAHFVLSKSLKSK